MEGIREFLSVGYGDGYGSGYGDGSGDGYGDGYGSGYGYGSGSGSGSGYGSGYGYGSGSGSGYGSGDGYGSGSGSGDGSGDGNGYSYGSGIKSINGNTVHVVDGIQTIIDHIHGNIAKGRILQNDMTLTPCYIVKSGDLFAHGETLREAMRALNKKLFEDMPVEERVDAFLAAFPGDGEYPVQAFFEWHNRLTGSCEMGRRAFAKDHGIDIDHGKMTVDEFIRLTRDAYGGDVIRKVEKARAKR